ncbi:MAG: hypothetical protein CM1200mP10_20650 [Candidatus Neomarinimicrobiota bacterium]|nr:MAG: hypothetical protein CM1200mP10_20650 [Candidatus Neomarinimicrobiota bacterium]
MKTIRLMGHAGSDIESGYHKQETIEKTEFNDPLLHSSRILIENKCLSPDDILNLYKTARQTINHVCESAAKRPKLKTAENVMESITAHTFNRKFRLYQVKKIGKLFLERKLRGLGPASAHGKTT